ncbi:TetR family transcriptional regulator [Niabella ginsenosidivorans]|uniref:Biofilm operon icaADBC HTH-type negative transcriptional regulator IcaR n=1 Tax=Niabella ginsenosidivorans TaxID=1176587 RepID=A0A1A9I8J6_9BACT|nr:TetR family transcriptional regulator [Niabella ginsenosidivorans]ANH83030.1 TetR family transcriptional regulator [Niabella ginsenosidivorans]
MGRKSLREPRQKEIVKAFYKVAKKEGLEETSIAKIAEVMDINPSLIVHYFKNKQELVYALITYILDKYLLIYEVENTENPKVSDLRKMIDNLFSKKWNRLFDDGLFYSCYALTFRDKRVQQMYLNIAHTLRSRLAAFIAACNREKILSVKNVDEIADRLFVLVDGSYFYLSVITDKKEYEQIVARHKAGAYALLGIS